METIVVGGGVIGLAVAQELASRGQEVLLVEAAGDIGTGTSSRNSEVIHASLYYPEGSLKRRLCLEGAKLLYAFCATHGVEARAIGKLVVATGEAETGKLETIFNTAKASGVSGLQWLDGAQAKALEPAVDCKAAFLSPSTGIVDGRGFMMALRGMAETHGATVALRTAFLRAEISPAGFDVELAPDGEAPLHLTCRRLINCAGLGAHQVAKAVSGYDHHHLPPQFFAKGSYCSVSGRSPFSRLIYPVPVPGALGIHVTVDLGGQARLGPDITWIDAPDYGLASDLPEKFRAACLGYWPGIATRELNAAYCGVRPKIHGPDKGFADFAIQGPLLHGVDGLVQLFGIESPGLTSSLAIARHVAVLLDD